MRPGFSCRPGCCSGKNIREGTNKNHTYFRFWVYLLGSGHLEEDYSLGSWRYLHRIHLCINICLGFQLHLGQKTNPSILNIIKLQFNQFCTDRHLHSLDLLAPLQLLNLPLQHLRKKTYNSQHHIRNDWQLPLHVNFDSPLQIKHFHAYNAQSYGYRGSCYWSQLALHIFSYPFNPLWSDGRSCNFLHPSASPRKMLVKLGSL